MATCLFCFISSLYTSFSFSYSYPIINDKINFPVESPVNSGAKDTIPSSVDNNYFVSNRGSDTSNGKSAANPKLNIGSVETLIANSPNTGSTTSVNLDENSIFREEFDPVQNNIHVSTFGLSVPKKLARITGMDVVNEWNIAPSASGVYQHSLKNSIDLTNPGYTYIIVSEIDTALEKTHPISAVRYLNFVSSIEACNGSPGSYYTPQITTNPLMVYMHTSEGIPGKNKFRYEVTTRNFAINGYYIENCTYENLFLQSSSYGFGMLAAGKNTVARNIIFQGGGIHHTVIKSGQLDSCLFLPGPKGLKDEIAAVFYNAEGKDGNNRVTNTIFLDVPNALYTHTDGTVNHKSLVLDKVYAFADTTDAGNGLSAGDTDSIDVSNCYVEGYPTGWYGGGTKLNIRNSIFRKTNQSAINLIAKSDVTAEMKVSNSLIVTNGNDNNQNLNNGWTAYGIRSPYNNVNLEVSNTIIHSFSTWHGPYQTVTTLQVAGKIKAQHNIYICDVNDNNSVYMNVADNSGGRGTSTNVSSDYNAFILLRGSKFNWIAAPNNNNESSLSTLLEWQVLTGQDKNSITIDLRNNPLGLKAIFVDPENGNWTLAQTLQGDSIRKISAGMTTPPLFYPKRPLLENNETPFRTPGGFSTFSGSIKSETESELTWQTFNESQFSSFAIEYSLDKIHFMEVGSVKAINDAMNNSYQFVHSHQEADSIFYRVKCLNTDSSSFYSSVIELKDNISFESKLNIFPNPFYQTFTVGHPRRDSGTINIYDYSGRIIKIIAVIPRSSKTLVSLPDLPSGRYFVQWTSNHERLSGSVIR